MFDEHRRPVGRLFYLLAFVLVGITFGQSPPTTTISDVVYRADGTLAGGTLLISWPTFSTSSGQSVAAGRKSVTLGTGGSVVGRAGSEHRFYTGWDLLYGGLPA